MKVSGAKHAYLFFFFCSAICIIIISVLINNEFRKTSNDRLAYAFNLIADTHSERMDNLLAGMEKSVDSLAWLAALELESVDRLRSDSDYLHSYTEKVLDMSLVMARTQGETLSVYVRYNPGIAEPTSGFFWSRGGTDENFRQQEVTDLSRFSSGQKYAGLDISSWDGIEPTWIAPYYKDTLDKRIVSYIVPIRKDGMTIGIAGMDLGSGWLEQAVEEVAIYESGHAFLLDVEKGLHYHPAHVPGEWSADISPELFSLLEDTREDGQAVLSWNWRDTDHHMTFRRLINGMVLVVCAPSHEVYGSQNRTADGIAFLSAVMCFAVILLGGLAAWSSKRSIDRFIERETMLDALAGVYSRKYFLKKVKEKLEHMKEACCLVRINICNLKHINDLYGFESGDRLLGQIGEALIRDGEIYGFISSRFYSDRFYLCVPRSSFEQLPMRPNVHVPWLNMTVYLTYGVYCVEPTDDVSVSGMCDRADMALSMQQGRPGDFIYFYDDTLRRKKLREQELEGEMEAAMEDGQFQVYIQPKYDAQSQRIVGGEALVRWFHPEKGSISPGEFIPLFEKNGFIRKLDYYVWDICCAFIREMRDKQINIPSISINVSRGHFYGTDFQSYLQGLLDKYSLRPADIELEITETIYGESPEIIVQKCSDLRNLGFQIAMDDFGSGYSSLNMLKELPLDILKLDLRFLSGDERHQKRGRNIIRNLVSMAKEMGLQVVVEGVETKEQHDFICGLGDCLMQGYYFARPMRTKEFELLLRARGGI